MNTGLKVLQNLYVNIFFCKGDPASSVLVKLVLNLLQLCKLAANHPGGRDILGKHFLFHGF